MIFIQQKKNFFHILLYIFFTKYFYITGEQELYKNLNNIIKNTLSSFLQKGIDTNNNNISIALIKKQYQEFFSYDINSYFIDLVQKFKKTRNFIDYDTTNYLNDFYIFIIKNYIYEIILKYHRPLKVIKDNKKLLLKLTQCKNDDEQYKIIIQLLKIFPSYYSTKDNILLQKFKKIFDYLENLFKNLNSEMCNNLKDDIRKCSKLITDIKTKIRDPSNNKVKQITNNTLKINMNDIILKKFRKHYMKTKVFHEIFLSSILLINKANNIIEYSEEHYIQFKKFFPLEDLTQFKLLYNSISEINDIYKNNDKFIEAFSMLLILKEIKHTNYNKRIDKIINIEEKNINNIYMEKYESKQISNLNQLFILFLGLNFLIVITQYDINKNNKNEDEEETQEII